jgi:hypothetical protein
MGINRGPSSLYAIMLAQGWAPTEALSAIRAARPIAGLIYAADATSWWSRINLQPAQQVEEHQRAVREWFEMNNINVATVIRRIRQ